MNAPHVFYTLLVRRGPRKPLVGSARIVLGRVLLTALLLALTVPIGLPARPVYAQSPDGGFNPNANGSVFALAVQSDGEIVVGGRFTTLGGQTRNYIARLNADGTLDTTFDPGANDWVDALAVQSDGKLVVGGFFTTLGGQARNHIGRLSNDAAALQNLSADTGGTTVTWTRSGAGPEVWRVTFESSTDGVTYTPLGAGTHITGGWQLSGLTLPRGQNLFIRARGYYATGMYNGSASVVESVRNVYFPRSTIYLPLVLRQ